MDIEYLESASVSIEDVVTLYRRSTLGARRPVEKLDLFRTMVENSNLVITAWRGKHMVGVARTLTDFACVAYLADLVVDEDHQRQGIGKQLIEETRRRLNPKCLLVLLAAPEANGYYARLGFESHPRAWVYRGSAIDG